jgi:UrcA family protein
MTRFLIAAALACLAVPAAAAPAKAPTAVVRHADLDLGSPRDAQAMLGRIRKAAANVCLDRAGGSDIASIEAFETCHRATIEKAVADLAAPRVTEALNASSPKQYLARLP